MARARNIKPGFFANEQLAELPFETRLLFIGLWTLADREGRLEDRPKRIRAQVFPYDSGLDVDGLLGQLEIAGFVLRYEVGGERYAQVVNFAKHQVPHHKEVASEIPPPEGMPAVTKHAYDVPNDLRAAIFKRDGSACLKCGTDENLSVDHIEPLAKGGDNSPSNLQTLCKRCNSSKGDSTADYRKSNVESTLIQRKPNDGASCPTDSLIPDSLIPDSIKNTSSGKPDMPPGFTRFWQAWPKSDRKVAKAECAKRWRKRGLETQAEAIVAHVESIRGSRQWRDGYEPAPLTYLNQERWRDGETADQPRDWWLRLGYGSEELARRDGKSEGVAA